MYNLALAVTIQYGKQPRSPAAIGATAIHLFIAQLTYLAHNLREQQLLTFFEGDVPVLLSGTLQT